jgi:Ni/Co efflux regulator RcnB
MPVLSGWNRGGPGWDRNRAGQDWRRDHGGWDNNAPWRRNRTWWRGNPGWRLYAGQRIGFFFVPAFGYVSVPVEYRTRYWQAGDQLPNWFWRYQVRDYWNYGLPQPPPGCIWVWVGNDIALMDSSDGYIVDIRHNAW